MSIQTAGRSTPNQYLNTDYEDLSESLLDSLQKLEKEKLLCSTVQMMFNINAISKSSYTTRTENIRYFFRRGDLLYTCTLMIILNQCVSVSGPEGVPRHGACAVLTPPSSFLFLFFFAHYAVQTSLHFNSAHKLLISPSISRNAESMFILLPGPEPCNTVISPSTGTHCLSQKDFTVKSMSVREGRSGERREE